MDENDNSDLRNKKILIAYTEMDDWSKEDSDLSLTTIEELIKELKDTGLEKIYVKKITEPIAESLKDFDPKETVVFNWAECWGSDGTDYWTVPKLLEDLGFVYTGSDPRCLQETVDKVAVKKVMLANKVSTPVTKIYVGGELNGWDLFPALVKPAREHCSTGITRESVVDSRQELHKRIDYMLEQYGPFGVIVEDFIEGNEYNVAVWGNDKPEVLPIGMIDYSGFDDYHDRICSYDAKWREDSKEWICTPVVCPAPLEPELKEKIENLAIEVYKLFKIRDYARIDVRVRDGMPYVLDVNSNPDITISGGLVRSMRKAGYTYGQGVAKILKMALSRAR